jgi:hypothetical protein
MHYTLVNNERHFVRKNPVFQDVRRTNFKIRRHFWEVENMRVYSMVNTQITTLFLFVPSSCAFDVEYAFGKKSTLPSSKTVVYWRGFSRFYSQNNHFKAVVTIFSNYIVARACIANGFKCH